MRHFLEPGNWVARPRLVEQLSRCLAARLTLISAPPGFGKTSLLAEWLGSGPQPTPRIAWLALAFAGVAGTFDPLRLPVAVPYGLAFGGGFSLVDFRTCGLVDNRYRSFAITSSRLR